MGAGWAGRGGPGCRAGPVMSSLRGSAREVSNGEDCRLPEQPGLRASPPVARTPASAAVKAAGHLLVSFSAMGDFIAGGSF